MAAIYRNSPSRFSLGSTPTATSSASTTSYAHLSADSTSIPSSAAAALQAQALSTVPMRYNPTAVDGHCVPLPAASLPPRAGGSYKSHQHSSMAALNLAIPSSVPPPGATLGIIHTSSAPNGTVMTKHSYLAGSLNGNYMRQAPIPPYMSNQVTHSSPTSSTSSMSYGSNPYLPKMFSNNNAMHHPHLTKSPERLHVSPGVPTPIELSIYENKQPTGFLHVTVGNQTVEFLDGVANMPKKSSP